MAGNKKPRKKYVPRLIRRNTIAYVAESVTPIRNSHPDYILKQQLVTHNALADLVAGVGGKEAACVLIATQYICQTLAFKANLGREHRPLLLRSAQALRNILQRGSVMQDHTPTPDELEALNDMSLFHDAVLEAVTIGEIENARSDAIKTLDMAERQKRPVI